MTNDFDELASAYLDGQVTDAEAARVDNDPDLSARVEELRAVAGGLAEPVDPVDETLRRRQIAAALDAFDELASAGDRPQVAAPAEQVDSAGPVVELDRRRTAPPSRPAGRAGLPRWLALAAGLLVLVGGIGFLSQLDGLSTSDDSEASDSGAELATATTTTAAAGEAVAAEETEQLAEAESAEADDAAASERNAVAADTAADGDTGSADESASETTAGGFFPDSDAVDEARVAFAELPELDELEALALGPTLEPSLSRCAPDGTFDDEPIGSFLPVRIGSGDDERDGEVLFAETDPGPTPILLDSSCQPFE